MKSLFILLLLTPLFSMAQTVTATIDSKPIRDIAGAVLRDSGATFINAGQGAKVISVSPDGTVVRAKSILADQGIRIVETDSTIRFQRVEWVSFYTGNFTLGVNDDNIIYSGGSGTCTLPPASSFPGRYFTIINKSSTSTSLNVGGFLLLGKRSGKWVSYNGQWVLVLQTSISTNY